MIGVKGKKDSIEISKEEAIEIVNKLAEAKQALEELEEVIKRYEEFIDIVLTGMENTAFGPLDVKMIPTAVKLYAVGCSLRNRKPAGTKGH